MTVVAAQTTYLTYSVTTPTTSTSTQRVTSGGVSTQRIATTPSTTTTTTTAGLIETSAPIATTLPNSIPTIVSTMLMVTTVDSISSTSFFTEEASTISATSKATEMMTTIDQFESSVTTPTDITMASTFQPSQQTTYATSHETTSLGSLPTSFSPELSTTSAEELSTPTYQSEQTTSFVGLSSIGSSATMTVTSLSNELLSTGGTTDQLQTIASTLSSVFTDVTREETSTIGFTSPTSVMGISVATSTDGSEESTITDALQSTTEQYEQTSSDLSTATHGYSTEEVHSSTISDSTTRIISTDVASTLLSTEAMTIGKRFS